MDPDTIKEVLNKSNQFQKVKGGNPLIKLLVTGLVFYEGDKWAKHRKIINPAFHVDKLKVCFWFTTATVPLQCLNLSFTRVLNIKVK